MTRIEDQGLEDQDLEDHTLELGARSDKELACVDSDMYQSKGRDEGESMSTMRNFDNDETSLSQDKKILPPPTSPSQDKKMSIKVSMAYMEGKMTRDMSPEEFDKFDQPSSQDKKMPTHEPEAPDDSYKLISSSVELLDLTRKTSDELINQAMHLHKHESVDLVTLTGAMHLWSEAVWSGTRPGTQHLHLYVDEIKAQKKRDSKPEQKSWVGPNANFEDKHYETLDEFRAKCNGETLEKYKARMNPDFEPVARRIADRFPAEYRDDLFENMMLVWTKNRTVTEGAMLKDAQRVVAHWTEEDARSSPSQEGKVLPAAQVRPDHTPTAPSRDVNVITIRAQRIVDRLPAKYRGSLLHAIISKWTDDPSIEYETMERMAQAAVALSIEEDRPMLRLVGG
jgi:hypothetical protein